MTENEPLYEFETDKVTSWGELQPVEPADLDPTKDPTDLRPVGLPVTCDPGGPSLDLGAIAADLVAARVELERTEGDLAVAIREASTARDALRQLRPLVPPGPLRPSLRRLIDTGLGAS